MPRHSPGVGYTSEPEVVYDLPGGGQRLMQRSNGIHTTIVNGTVLVQNGEHTGAYPGQLLRNAAAQTTSFHSLPPRLGGGRTQEVAMANDVYAGKELGTVDLTITEEMVQHYVHGLEEPNPWYTTDSPFGGPVAPAIIFQDISSRFKGWYLDNLYGNLWMRQEWKIHAPARVGQTVHCSARVADRYAKRDREVVAQEVSLKDDAGQLVAWGMHHQSFLPEQTSGGVTLRDAKAKEGAKKHVEPTGEPLSLELKKTFTADMCNQFFYTSRNYHNDKQESEKLGFTEVVVGGRMTLSCITELLTRHFGRGFYLGGHVDVKFVNVLWLNEPFTTSGLITGRRVENGKTWADVAVSCDKADGTKLIVGTASVLEEA